MDRDRPPADLPQPPETMLVEVKPVRLYEMSEARKKDSKEQQVLDELNEAARLAWQLADALQRQGFTRSEAVQMIRIEI